MSDEDKDIFENTGMLWGPIYHGRGYMGWNEATLVIVTKERYIECAHFQNYEISVSKTNDGKEMRTIVFQIQDLDDLKHIIKFFNKVKKIVKDELETKDAHKKENMKIQLDW